MNFPVSESELIEFAKTVKIAATRVLEGLHPSPRGGEGVEFHSTLPYSEGEDVKHLDWKRYAATDRYFVNRFTREEKAGWEILIDSSPSMSYGEKAKWVRIWTAAICFLARVWGDRWSIFPDSPVLLEEAYELLAENKLGFQDPAQTLEHEFVGEAKKRDRLLVFSDFFWESEKLERIVKDWTSSFGQVCLIQILDKAEADFDFSGVIDFRDLESPLHLVLDSGRVRKRYLNLLYQVQERLKQILQPPHFSVSFKAGTDKIENQLLEFFERLT